MVCNRYTEEDLFQFRKDACRNKNSNLTFVSSKALGQARKPSIVYYRPALGNTYQYIQAKMKDLADSSAVECSFFHGIFQTK